MNNSLKNYIFLSIPRKTFEKSYIQGSVDKLSYIQESVDKSKIGL